MRAHIAGAQGARNARSDHWFCRPWPHGRPDGRTAARCGLHAVGLRHPERNHGTARRARRASGEISRRRRFLVGHRARQPADSRHREVRRARRPRHHRGNAGAHSGRPVHHGARRRQDHRGGPEAQEHHTGRCAGQRRHQGRGRRYAGGDGVLPQSPPSDGGADSEESSASCSTPAKSPAWRRLQNSPTI